MTCAKEKQLHHSELAMKWAQNLNFDHVKFEKDSKILIDTVHLFTIGIYEFSSVVLSIQSSYNFEVKFIRRQVNIIAHALAKAANSSASRKVYD
jgi:hypothetical protein